MDYIKIGIASIASIIVMFLVTKLRGNRVISQMSLFDYVSGITIGSIAAEMATELEDMTKPLLALIIYGVVTFTTAAISCKSVKFRSFVSGKPMILYDNGRINVKNMRRAKIDINEFLSNARARGFFDLSNIETAVFELNGDISFLPKENRRPVTPEDMEMSPEQQYLLMNVIIDGRVMWENLRATGNNEKWLEKQLALQGIGDPSIIALATCDRNNSLCVYKKIVNNYKNSLK